MVPAFQCHSCWTHRACPHIHLLDLNSIPEAKQKIVGTSSPFLDLGNGCCLFSSLAPYSPHHGGALTPSVEAAEEISDNSKIVITGCRLVPHHKNVCKLKEGNILNCYPAPLFYKGFSHLPAPPQTPADFSGASPLGCYQKVGKS